MYNSKAYIWPIYSVVKMCSQVIVLLSSSNVALASFSISTDYNATSCVYTKFRFVLSSPCFSLIIFSFLFGMTV